MSSKVFFVKEINSENLVKIYETLGRELKGNVAVKISTGEMGGHNFLDPQLIKPLVDKLNGTIVECNTAYGGSRATSEKHWETIKEHGFLDIAKVDIMDEEGEEEIPLDLNEEIVEGVTPKPLYKKSHLSGRDNPSPKGFDIVGSHLKNYDSMLMLSHFKGHAMGGFGGALKNMSIGVASGNGKAWIHSVGRTKNQKLCWTMTGDQDGFLESMAEADKAVMTFFKSENMAFINVANNLSVDCDCDSNPADPEMEDLGIFASLDPVALDQACYDAVQNASDDGKSALIERMDSRHGIHTIENAAALGLGVRDYEIVEL